MELTGTILDFFLIIRMSVIQRYKFVDLEKIVCLISYHLDVAKPRIYKL